MRNPILRPVLLLRSRPILFISAALSVVCLLVLQLWAPAIRLTTQLLLSWNAGAVLYLLLFATMVLPSSHQRMQLRARRQDEGQFAILSVAIMAGLMCLAAIVAELASVKDLAVGLKLARIALAALTIITSWLFLHTMFALHYAHAFYMARAAGQGDHLEFPGEQHPDYFDFLYFSFVIGVAAQTADVSIRSRAMRRTTLLHCVLAFFFNTTLLALTINIAAGLI